MWAKSAARELSKWVPLSAEYQRAVQLDDAAERGQQSIEMSGILNLPEQSEPAAAPKSQSDRIAERMKGQAVEESESAPNPDSEPTEEEMLEGELTAEARRLDCPKTGFQSSYQRRPARAATRMRFSPRCLGKPRARKSVVREVTFSARSISMGREVRRVACGLAAPERLQRALHPALPTIIFRRRCPVGH